MDEGAPRDATEPSPMEEQEEEVPPAPAEEAGTAPSSSSSSAAASAAAAAAAAVVVEPAPVESTAAATAADRFSETDRSTKSFRAETLKRCSIETNKRDPRRCAHSSS